VVVVAVGTPVEQDTFIVNDCVGDSNVTCAT